MKKIASFITIILIVLSCTTTREAQQARSEVRKDRSTANQAIVKQAVESKRYIIKLDRMYFRYGGIIDLYPRANYIIIDGEKAVISTAYMGRQFDIRPVAGINMTGRPTEYELTNNISKGKYQIKTVVKNGANSFDLYLTIGREGTCNVTLSNYRLDYVNYKGYLVPIQNNAKMPLQNMETI